MLTGRWAKSTFSFSNGNCVEARWRKPRRSMNQGNCAELAADSGRVLVLVRDTKDRGGPVLAFRPGAWRAFTGSLKASA